MENSKEVAPFQEPQGTVEPLHMFTGRSGTGVELHVYADHLELHSARGKEVRALWYRHIRTLVPSRKGGSEALAIIDRGGRVFVVPMAHDQVAAAQWLIAGMIEWAERSQG